MKKKLQKLLSNITNFTLSKYKCTECGYIFYSKDNFPECPKCGGDSLLK